MSFIILLLIAVLITLSFLKYRKIYSVLISALVILGLTTGALFYGLNELNQNSSWILFGKKITWSNYINLIIVWYSADILCSVIIIRNYFEYKKINP